MPVGSSVQELINALRDRKTNITRALDDLFGNQAALDKLKGTPGTPGHPDLGALATPDVFGKNPGDPLPPWARDELKKQGWSGLVAHALTDDEIAHIENWPPEHKEELRVALDTAIQNGPPLKFYWELHGGNSEEMDDSVPGQLIFRTPQKNVRLSGWFANIKVKVGK
jgi:hypothetical protein